MDRKSARIKPADLATPIVAMANADGGFLIIGVEDDGTITGVDEKNLNEYLRVPLDFCIPSVEVKSKVLDVIDKDGKPNHILRMQIMQSTQVVANQADDVFLRVGDKSKKLNFDQRLQLVYAKGVKYFEDQPVSGATIDDIDLEYVKSYCEKIGYTKGNAEHYLRHNKDFIITANKDVAGSADSENGKNSEDRISAAAILLFAHNPQRFFPRARIRFVRYEGNKAEVGNRMNVIKDISFDGKIIDQVKLAIEFVRTQIREYTKLGEGAVFKTIPEYPEFCWTELIVNAVAHRDYSIKGTDIQVKMFDDHITVESPGILPGLVKVDNIREIHFSRNPKIVELLVEYDLVKEFGEGVDRIYRDMADAGLPEPVYKQNEFMLYATLKNNLDLTTSLTTNLTTSGEVLSGQVENDEQITNSDDDKIKSLLEYCKAEPHSAKEIQEFLNIKSRRYVREKLLQPLLDAGKLHRMIPDKPNSPKQKYYAE